MKKLFLLVIVLFILTGCSDYEELTDIGIVSLVTLDKVNNKYKIIVQVLDSEKKEDISINPSVVLYKSVGNTIEEAFKNLSLESPKKLYTGHIRTVIVKDSVLKDGSSSFIDFVLRNREIEKDFKILVTEDSIESIVNVVTPLSIPSESISNSLEISSYNGITSDISFDDFLNKIYSKGVDPLLPVIKAEKIDKDYKLVLDKNLAAFKEDKFINFLSYDASIGYNLLNDNNKGIITFKCDENNYASLELIDTKSDIKYDINKNQLNIDLDITSTLNELNCNIDISKKEGLNTLKSMFNNRIKDIINNTIDEQKENNVDYLGIERYVFQNNYNYYRNNNVKDIIANVNSNINLNVTFTEKSGVKKGDEKHYK